MKKLKITLRKDGTQKIEVLGAEGSECLAFSAELEARLGSLAGKRVLKPEYSAESRFETEAVSESLRTSR